MKIHAHLIDQDAFEHVIDVYQRRLKTLGREKVELQDRLEEIESQEGRLMGIIEDLMGQLPAPSGPFADVTMVEAMAAVLGQEGPLEPAEISDLVLKGGFQTKAENFHNNVIVALNKAKAPDGPFVKHDDGKRWSLASGVAALDSSNDDQEGGAK